METRDILLVIVPIITGFISFFTSYLLSRSKSKQDLGILMRKFEIDLEAQKEKHKLEIDAMERAHKNALDLKDREHLHKLEQQEKELEGSAKYNAIGSLMGNPVVEEYIKNELKKKFGSIKPRD
jgi:hypothetical protein